MAFDHTQAPPGAILARLEKFKRRAKDIVDEAHFEQILNSFPPADREAVRSEVEPLVTFRKDGVVDADA